MDGLVKQDDGKNIVNSFRDPRLFFPPAWFQALFGESAIETAYKAIVENYFYNSTDKKWNIPSDGKPEEAMKVFFNDVVETVALCFGHHISHSWRRHSEKLIEDFRKPDLILVRKELGGSIYFRDIASFCEIKQSTSNGNDRAREAQLQVTELAGYALTSQVNRRFYVTSSICNRDFTLALFSHGVTVQSLPFNIDQHPQLFITALVGLTLADLLPVWNGFHSIMRIQEGGVYRVGGFQSQGQNLLVMATPLLLFSAKALHGRGTKVPICTVKKENHRTYHCPLKISWHPTPCGPNGETVLQPAFTDVEVYELMKTRIHELKGFEEKEYESIFGPDDRCSIFKDAVPVKSILDSKDEPALPHLRGIARALDCKRSESDNPTPSMLCPDYYHLPLASNQTFDSTSNIVKRFTAPPRDAAGEVLKKNVSRKAGSIPLFVENRECIMVLYGDCGTCLVWFSCRRELLSGMMGALAGHFNALRMDILHCDVSEANILFEVESADPEHVVPNFPESSKDYLKRAGMLADWGYAVDLRLDEERIGRVTGTLPYMASELLSLDAQEGKIVHEVHHDLEAFFWVLWIMCVNMDGPFYKHRSWADETDDPSKRALANPNESGAAWRSVGNKAAILPAAPPPLPSLAAPPPPLSPATPARPAFATIHSAQAEGLSDTPAVPAWGASILSGDGVEAPAAHSREETENDDFQGSPVVHIQQQDTRAIPDIVCRHPADGGVPVPIWATPGVHSAAAETVSAEKKFFPTKRIIASLSPYFSSSGNGFIAGLEKLHGYFIDSKRDGPPINHAIFIQILKDMLDSIDSDKDRPSQDDIADARQRYTSLKEQGGSQGIAISVLDGPKSKAVSKSLHAFPPGSRGKGSSKRSASGVPAGSHEKKLKCG